MTDTDTATPLDGWLLLWILILVTVVIIAMFALTFYNLSAPRSTMKNLFGLKPRAPFRYKRDDSRHSPSTSAAALFANGGLTKAGMTRLLDTMTRSARVGKRTTRTTLAITGFALLCVLVVAVLGLSGQGVRDLRTQVAAAVITLVATIAGFYFGSQTAADAQAGNTAASPTAVPHGFVRDPTPTNAKLVVGTPGAYTPAQTGTAPTKVLLANGELPSGMQLDPSTGAVTGTPAAGSAGTYPITLNALYADGSYTALDEELTVTEAAPVADRT